MDPALRASLLAGVAGGVVGASGFAVWHKAWIALAPPASVMGLLAGIPAGVLLGLAYHHLRREADPLAGGVRLALLVAAALLPMLAAAALGPPPGAGPVDEAAGARISDERVMLALAGGALAGLAALVATRRPRGALWVGIAGLAVAMMASVAVYPRDPAGRDALLVATMLATMLAGGALIPWVRRRMAPPRDVLPGA